MLNGAAGLNIWSAGGVSRPQRSARLYRALVDKGLASTVTGALMPTEHPYLYRINASVAEGQSLSAVEERGAGAKSIGFARGGITPAELKKVHAQLRARFVYDADSVTDIAHQLGYFETIASWQAYHDTARAARRRDAGQRARRRVEVPHRVQPHDRLVRAGARAGGSVDGAAADTVVLATASPCSRRRITPRRR